MNVSVTVRTPFIDDTGALAVSFDALGVADDGATAEFTATVPFEFGISPQSMNERIRQAAERGAAERDEARRLGEAQTEAEEEARQKKRRRATVVRIQGGFA